MSAVKRRDYRAAKNKYLSAKAKYEDCINNNFGGKHDERSPVVRMLYLQMERALDELKALDY